MAKRKPALNIGRSLILVFPFVLMIGTCLAGAADPVASETPAGQLQEMLDSEALARADNPVSANFFLQDGRNILSAADDERIVEQIRLSLRRQTSFVSRAMDSAIGAMSGENLRRVMEQASKQSAGRSMLGGMLGMPPQQTVTARQQQQIQTEIQEGIAAPWIKGMEAAKALERLGEAQAAGRFYLNCLQMDPAEWFADVCLDGIVQMGTSRAHALLSWMVDNAEKASLGAQIPAASNNGDNTAMLGAVPLRAAGLRGLGTLIGGGQLSEADRELAWKTILGYSTGKKNAPYFAGAAAALGLTQDPRAVERLRELSEWKKDPRAAQAAQRALAVAFGDKDARAKLRRHLKDEDIELRLRAARALLEADDDEAYQWTVDQVTSHRSADSNEIDIRPRIVRELADRGNMRSRQVLEKILAEGAGNDWLQSWVAVALLELGDESQLPAVRQAVGRSNWTLDKSGIGSLWRRISPLVNLAIQATFSQVNVMQSVQTVGNMIAQERARAQRKATDQALVSLQIRWQAADALAGSGNAEAVELLSMMMDDPDASVRLSAARGLALNTHKTAGPAIIKAFTADFGSDGKDPRTPQVRASLLRAAIARDPEGARQLCQKGSLDTDPGVRFIALLTLLKYPEK